MSRLQGVLRWDAAPLAGFVALAFLFSRFNSFGANAAAIPPVAAFGVGAFAFVRQLGRHKADQDSLDDAEQRYRTLVEQLPIATYVLRAFDSKVVYVAPQIERLLELTAEQALDEPDFWSARLHPLDREHVLREWYAWSADPSAEPFRSSYRMVAESGRVLWIDDVTVRVGEGSDQRFKRHLLDVSEQRQLEDQLRQTQKFEALGRLAGGVAHDFNNLLAVVAGHSERLAARLPGGADRESAESIAAAAERGSTLVRQLLAFSRPQAADRRLIDLNSLVGEFVPMLRHVIGEDVVLELALQGHPLPVEVDPARIDQVLMNLVVNARDAMPDGGRLTITTGVDVEESAADGVVRNRAVVMVSDTGPGMDAETQERIFEPFFTTKEPGKGSGLGLATASSIVRQSGGSITVSSTAARGTTFRIHLPLATAKLQAVKEASAESAAPLGGSETVLVVEDEPALRELEQLMLEDAGYDVLAAENAAEALELARRHAVDVVVVDIVMPGMSGPRFVDELRARGREVPAIYVSGYGTDELSNRGVATGDSPVIQKPFHADVLLGNVRDVLDATAGVSLSRVETAVGRDAWGTLHAVSPAPSSTTTTQTVRCLGCGVHYRQPLTHDCVARSGCPGCGYVGWANAV